jgi:hypothetical protein
MLSGEDAVSSITFATDAAPFLPDLEPFAMTAVSIWPRLQSAAEAPP